MVNDTELKLYDIIATGLSSNLRQQINTYHMLCLQLLACRGGTHALHMQRSFLVASC